MRIAYLALLAIISGTAVAAADETAVGVAELAKDPASFKGKAVVISDCLVLSLNKIVGAQCTTKPMDPSTLVYIDADTWTPEADKVLLECDTTDITKLCLLKVTGVADLDGRGQALVKNATVELLERTSAM